MPGKYIRLVQDMYRGCKTVVRSAAGESNSFGAEVGLQQGSALSPYLFLLLMGVLTEDVRKDVRGSMMFAEDIVLCGDDETDMTEYLDTWRRALEDRGMMISRPKTQFIDFKFGQDNGQGREPVKILGEELQRVHHFKYRFKRGGDRRHDNRTFTESECSMEETGRDAVECYVTGGCQ